MVGSREDQILDWLRGNLRKQGRDLLGDDAALLPAGGPWAVTMDSQIARVHFPAGLDPRLVAKRLLAVNLSDLAACGARPHYAFLALAAPVDFPYRLFLSTLVRACRRHALCLAGGDLARSPVPTATLTLIGSRVAGGRWLRRSAAKPGERLWVGGTLGESAAGRRLMGQGARMEGSRVVLPEKLEAPARLAAAARRAVRRHLLPRPQLELGHWLASRRRGACIDLSDGLARDLHRLCQESSVGAEVEASSIPTARNFTHLCRAIDSDPLELALGGGEDYVLLFSLPEGVSPPPQAGCQAIGQLQRSKRVRLLRGGSSEPLPPLGWDHFHTTR